MSRSSASHRNRRPRGHDDDPMAAARVASEIGPADSSGLDHEGTGSLDSLFRSWSSLFAWKNSLFELLGNSFPTDWTCPGISAELASAMRESGEIPCSLPFKQGIAPREEFAPESLHRHSACRCRGDCGPRIGTGEIRADSRRLVRIWSWMSTGDGALAEPGRAVFSPPGRKLSET